MQRAVFKRETIQLKYLPKVEKKNAQDKTSQGKLSRQIANLKQTLKHTTESSIQLDTTVEHKLKELQHVNDQIKQSMEEAQNMEDQTQMNQLKLLAIKVDKQRNLFDIINNQTQGKRFDEVGANKFRSTIGMDRIDRALEDQQTQNMMIENAIKKISEENPDAGQILLKLAEW